MGNFLLVIHKAKCLIKAILAIANEYETGEGELTRDIEKAGEWYKKSAEKGEPYGEYKLANMYEFGWVE